MKPAFLDNGTHRDHCPRFNGENRQSAWQNGPSTLRKVPRRLTSWVFVLFFGLASFTPTQYYQPPPTGSVATIFGVWIAPNDSSHERAWVDTVDGLPLLGPQNQEPALTQYAVGSGTHWVNIKYDLHANDRLWGLLTSLYQGEVLTQMKFIEGHDYLVQFSREGMIVQIWVLDKATDSPVTPKLAVEIKQPPSQEVQPMFIYVPTK